MTRYLFSAIMLAFMAISAVCQCVPSPPPALRPGDKVAIISLGSTPRDGVVQGAVNVLRQWGFEVKVGRNVMAKHAMYAGTTEQRLDDLLEALRDPDVKAIISTRGGYGTSLVLNELPIDTLRRYPKWIVGYSDITSIHGAMVCAGWQSMHANMCGALAERGADDPVSLMLRDALLGRPISYNVEGHPLNHPGVAEGILVGGNMSVACLLSGSKDYDFLDPDHWAGQPVVLFFEDVSESMPRVMSMLYQMKLKGLIGNVKGIIVGRFTDYKPDYGYTDMYALLDEYLQGYDIPICYNFPVGHDEQWNYPLVEGCRVMLDVQRGGVTLKFER